MSDERISAGTTRLIMGVDPGKTTGVVIVDVGLGKPVVVHHAQVDFDDAPLYFEARLGPDSGVIVDLVAIERYVITRRTARLSHQPEALYVTGGVIFLARCLDVRVVRQTMADAKAIFSNAWLTELDMFGWVKGPHARDALRQALLAARRLGVAV